MTKPLGSLEVKFISTTSLVRAALAARSSWLRQQDRSSARQVFEANRNARYTWSAVESGEVASKIEIPSETMDSLLTRIQEICLAFGECFDEQSIGVKYGDGDIDEACRALPQGLCREIERIVSLNGIVPAPHLDILYGRARHLAVS